MLLTNGNSKNEKDVKNYPSTKHVKARFVSAPKSEVTENNVSDKKHNKENEVGKTYSTKYGRNKGTCINGDGKELGDKISYQKSDIPVKRVTTKSKHIKSNIVNGELNNTEKKFRGKHRFFETKHRK